MNRGTDPDIPPSAPVDSDDPTRDWPLCVICGKSAREGNHCTALGVGHDYDPGRVGVTETGSEARR